MKIRLPGRRRAAEAGRAKDGRNAPEPAPVTWARAQLREQIQRAGSALSPAAEPANRPTHKIDRPPLADMEAEP
jgi:hypothetical protein